MRTIAGGRGPSSHGANSVLVVVFSRGVICSVSTVAILVNANRTATVFTMACTTCPVAFLATRENRAIDGNDGLGRGATGMASSGRGISATSR